MYSHKWGRGFSSLNEPGIFHGSVGDLFFFLETELRLLAEPFTDYLLSESAHLGFST